MSTNKIPVDKSATNLNSSIDQTTVNAKKGIEKHAEKLLQKNGMLEAYKYVLSNFCKHGLPTGDVFEYSAYLVLNYEKKW